MSEDSQALIDFTRSSHAQRATFPRAVVRYNARTQMAVLTIQIGPASPNQATLAATNRVGICADGRGNGISVVVSHLLEPLTDSERFLLYRCLGEDLAGILMAELVEAQSPSGPFVPAPGQEYSETDVSHRLDLASDADLAAYQTIWQQAFDFVARSDRLPSRNSTLTGVRSLGGPGL